MCLPKLNLCHIVQLCENVVIGLYYFSAQLTAKELTSLNIYPRRVDLTLITPFTQPILSITMKTIKTLVFISMTLLITSCLLPQLVMAEIPKPAVLLKYGHSVAKVHVENAKGRLGVGSSVVVAENHVATNCHVVANARGVAINKLGNSYQPIAMKADWHHDLCILIFDNLPLKPFPLGDINSINYEDTIIAIGFSGNTPKPTESFGTIKALVPFDDSQLIRTNSGFRMGASGGALITYEGTLLGLTTFKSPGRNGQYYSLPVTWIKALLASPTRAKTTDAKPPFWDAPANQRPFFMQVVIPMQNKQWAALAAIANKWTLAEGDNPEAWFYLGQAQLGLGQLTKAKTSLNRALGIAPRHSSVLHTLGNIAMRENNRREAERLGQLLVEIDVDYADYYYEDVGLKTPTSN